MPIPNTHLVSADHVHPDFCFTNTPVRVSEYGSSGIYYAVHPKLGCGRNCTSPEKAIYSLFNDSACTVTGIRPIPVEAEAEVTQELVFADQQTWLDTIWDALHAYRETSIPEGTFANDDAWSDITTAMAWITEGLGLPTGADAERETGR